MQTEHFMVNPLLSPLTFSENVSEIGKIDPREITAIYSKYFKMDVASYFKGIPEIKIFKCLDTQYMFYHPFETEGDENYYAQMGKADWYYNPSRWEHQKALELINTTEKVLEVGAGSGFFLSQLKKKNRSLTGLELNGKAIEHAKSLGIELKKELVQDHAQNHPGEYDIICSFQVLEHISQPFSFLEAQVACLKPGGKLLIGVPNNDSYMKDNKMYNKVLNMPPHHMGLWTRDSLKSLEKIFNLALENVFYEPLVGGNVDVYMWNRINRFFLGISFFTRAIWKLRLHTVYRYFLLKKAHKIRGNSMLAIFKKN